MLDNKKLTKGEIEERVTRYARIARAAFETSQRCDLRGEPTLGDTYRADGARAMEQLVPLTNGVVLLAGWGFHDSQGGFSRLTKDTQARTSHTEYAKPGYTISYLSDGSRIHVDKRAVKRPG